MPVTSQIETLETNEWVSDLCSGDPDELHMTCCGGTGKRHPEFWERCWGCTECTNMELGWGDSVPPKCDGSGWVLAVTLEKVLAQLQPRWSVMFVPSEGQPECRLFEPDGSDQMYSAWGGQGDDRLAAALDALRQVGMK